MNIKLSHIRSLLLVVFAAILLPNIAASHVNALSGSEFQPGRIIDNEIFFSAPNMNSQQIQAFLNAKVPICDTNGTQPYAGTTRAAYGTSKGYPPPYTCLKDYQQITTVKVDEPGLCKGFPTTTLSAADIIYGVAQSCGVSPQVLITLLQKEQSLITDDWPWSIQYRSATGYGCPDSAPCDAQYYGFFNQVYSAARVFKYYAVNPGSFNYIPGRNNYVAYNPSASCGGSSIFIRNQATAGLYNYTPYQPNSAALANLYGSGDSCSAYGNRNFWRMYNDWFGVTILPQAIKTASSSSVYIYTNGFKIGVPAMGLLQDYGINPNAIQTIDQTTFNAIPSPDGSSGISSNIGYLVKSTSDTDADGGAVYVVSVGKKYAFQSMAQFADFGFDVSNIAYLPLNYLVSIPSGDALSNYITTPTSNAFQVSSGKKRIIFYYPIYSSLNPSGANTLFSIYTASQIASGDPITNTPLMVRRTNGAISLFSSNTYYGLPSLDVFSCTGLDGPQGIPLYGLSDDTFVAQPNAQIPLGCLVTDNSGTTHVLNRDNKLTVPAAFGSITGQTPDVTITSLINKLPTSANQLKQAVKGVGSPAVWWLENGTRRPVPSLSNYILLRLNTSNVDVVYPSAIAAMQTGKIKLGDGQTVKSTTSGAVFAIQNNSRYTYASGEDFTAYRNSWSAIESYNQSELDAAYPLANRTISKYLVDGSSSYLVDTYGCYLLNTQQLASFGQNQAALLSAQTYTRALFPQLSLSSCGAGSTYIKQYGQSTIYLAENGSRRAFTSWSSFLAYSNQTNPKILDLSSTTIQSLPLGGNM